MDVFLGSLMLVGFNYAPRGFALCQGQLMSISQNTALYALLGTMYGGDGRSTFALPNLQGNLAIGMGTGPGLQPYVQGETGGTTTVTLLSGQVPPHNHSVLSAKGSGSISSPSSAASLAQAPIYAAPGQAAPMNAQTLGGSVGGNNPHNNMMPYLGLYWIIALQGIFPPRS